MPFLDENASRYSTTFFGRSGIILWIMGLLYSSIAIAEDNNRFSMLNLGVGVKNEETPYKGRDRETTVLPLFQYENDYIAIFGPGIAFKLPAFDISDSQKLTISIVGEYDAGSGYKSDDAQILKGMHKRKSSIWTGGRVGWETELVDVTAEWLGDVSGNSKGQHFSLGLEQNWQCGDHLMITPRLVGHWYDKRYVDYYFGVRPNEIRPDRTAYSGKSGVNVATGLRVTYMFNRIHSLLVDAEVSTLSSGIKDSPLVDQSNQNSVMFGYIYHF